MSSGEMLVLGINKLYSAACDAFIDLRYNRVFKWIGQG